MHTKKNFVFGCLITGVYDVNRSTSLPDNDALQFASWAKSLEKNKVNGIIFHNNLHDDIIQSFGNTFLQFKKINFDQDFNPNVFRYKIYVDYLVEHHHEIENIFVTDISDVLMLQNPFIYQLFLENKNKLFCGDEPKILRNEWMICHGEHLRNNLSSYADFEIDFQNEILLNCGIIGGNIRVVKPFLEQLWSIHKNYNYQNKTLFTGDMGAFNYLVRTKFQNAVIHGAPINTVFKDYDAQNNYCWFSHK